ncbi:transglutaminase TgpA family protein [Andreprevotia chitinilytica]|uniref:transglutaminase TgpA family protein n=1 Tax=Andreprevotia chitinilytica TaxID=396808 RepID=UPI00068B0BA7|nr:DUF3488 and transglutaminase-like domain-containing protein [Andreprevotia chitinilytica]
MRTTHRRDDLPRQPLYGLVAALALVLLPHLTQLALWHAALILLPLAWRAWLAWRGKALPPRWLRLVCAAGLMLIVFVQFRTLIGRDGGVVLLASLVSAKLLETANRRDARILSLLAYFTTGAAFLVSQSFWMLAYTIVCTLVITAQLHGWQRLDGKLPWTEYRRAGWMLLEALPVALLLFVIFPRLSGPLWQMPADKPGASSGLSDRMSPGSFTDLALDDSVAFRVDFEGKPPSKSSLYWRGPVYERFDGRNWEQAFGTTTTPTYEAIGPTYNYTVTLEPHNRSWLLGLDLPTPGKTLSGVRITSRLQAVSEQVVTQRKRVTLSSVLTWKMADDNPALQQNLLQNQMLPRLGNPRARALAEGWRNLSPNARLAAALTFLGSGKFTYTLDAPLLLGPDPVDTLLFQTREGFCEHYASAFVYLMRAAGVPARVVGGYLGGEFNDNYLIVRQTDAHAWAEVWLPGLGWQRVDPTAVVAPGRVTQGIAHSVRGAERLPLLLQENAAWLAAARLRWDAVVYGWDRWVIGYDTQRQLQLFGQLGIDDFSSPRFIGWLSGTLLALLLLYWAILNAQRSRKTQDAARQQWSRWLRMLAKQGLVPSASEGPRDFAQRVARHLPANALAAHAIGAAYIATRYADRPEALAELRRHVSAFRPG